LISPYEPIAKPKKTIAQAKRAGVDVFLPRIRYVKRIVKLIDNDLATYIQAI
jgi:hypothetical protein